MKPQCPQRLRSKTDRSRFDRIINDLLRHDLDTESRAELVADYVEIDRQIVDLRKDLKGGTIATRLATTRALNVATAERRRLHQRLFAGGRKPEEAVPTVAAEAAAKPSSLAVEEWRRHIHGRHYGKPQLRNDGTPEMTRLIAEFNREHEELTARFGRPSWSAMLYATDEEEIEAKREIEASRNMRWQRKQRRAELGSDAL